MFRSRLYFAIINYIGPLTARFEISIVTWSSVAPGNNNVPALMRAYVYTGHCVHLISEQCWRHFRFHLIR